MRNDGQQFRIRNSEIRIRSPSLRETSIAYRIRFMDVLKPRPTSRFVDALIRFRWPLLILAAVLAAIGFEPSRRLEFDRSVERMFAGDDPLLPPYRELKEQFGGNEVVLAVYRDPSVFDPEGDGLERLRKVSDELAKVPGVQEVLSLPQISDLLGELKTVGGRGLLNLFGGGGDKWTGPEVWNPKSETAKRFRELFEGYTHSSDGQTVGVVCILTPEPPPGAPRAETIEQMRRIIESPGDGLQPGVLAGEPVMVVEGFDMLERDGRRLGYWSTLLLGLTILLCFRSIRWLVVPILVVQWALLMTRAILVLSGMQLTMVSSMLTAIVTVIGVAAVVHLIVHFQHLREQGAPPEEALRRSGTRLAWPIVGASATDVAGFASLRWAEVGPVSDFGTMMGLGALLVLFALMMLTPGLILIGRRDGSSKTNEGSATVASHQQTSWLDRQLNRMLTWLIEFVQRRPIWIAAAAFVLALIAVVGSARLRVETDFTRNFRDGSRIVHAYEFVESNLGGAGVWDVMIPAPERLDPVYLDRVRKLEDRLRAIELPALDGNGTRPGLTKVISLADVLDATSGDRMAAIAPAELRAKLLAEKLPAFMLALRSKTADEFGESRLRIMLRAHERQPAEEKRRLIDEVTRIVQEEFPPSDQSQGAQVTGLFVLLTSIVESMLRDQWITFAVASASIGLMMLVALRSLKLALIALAPNVLPILLVMGLWGLLGLKINMGAAMIAAVSMGLSIDSSMHYLVDFQRARRSGKSFAEAIGEAQTDVGKAMIYTTLAVIVGFGVLTISEFIPTVYFGTLVSLTMLGGLAGNLVVLPGLLSLFARR